MEEDDTISILIDFEIDVNLVRFVGGGLLPSKLSIKAEVIPTEETKDDDFDVTFTKIKFWFDTIVTRSIAFRNSNEDAMIMLMKDGKPRMANHLMMTPNEPTDEHLAVLFQSKMQALSNNKFNFGMIKVKSDSSNGLTFSYVGSWDEDLPEMKDWFATKPYYFETPWWTRDDISTIDMIFGEFDAEKIPAWATKLDFIEQSMRSEDEKSEEKIATESVIIKGQFKPKIIDGEKSETETD